MHKTVNRLNCKLKLIFAISHQNKWAKMESSESILKIIKKVKAQSQIDFRLKIMVDYRR